MKHRIDETTIICGLLCIAAVFFFFLATGCCITDVASLFVLPLWGIK